jgi:hypothetical protein
MLEFHKLNPNALLVLLGSAIYAAAGGPFVIAGGVVIGILLGLHHRRQEARGNGNGPTTLFGAPAPASHADELRTPFLTLLPAFAVAARR